MKAITYKEYGPPETVLRQEDIPTPEPRENEVLVRVRAAAINDYDWGMVRGLPRAYRLLFGIGKPKHPVPGMELAGTVEATGANAKSFQVGDAVYGDISEYGFGAFAEYVRVNEKALRLKPEKMSFEAAAAIPHASLLALQGLRDIGKIQDLEPGAKILINGAGGGVGTLGLPMAKMRGAEVTGVDTGEKLEMMESIGFDHVLDYKQVDFTRTGERYDLILDTKTTRSPFAYARCLKPGGTYVTVGGFLPRILMIFLLGPLFRLIAGKTIRVLGLQPNQGLDAVEELFIAGKIECVMDGPYGLEDVPRLIQYFGEGLHGGKVVVSLE